MGAVGEATQSAVSPITAWRDFSEPGLPPLLQAAADCFVENGYHGTTIRTIAARAGLSVPGYYHHFESKPVVLIAIMRSAMSELYARSRAADTGSGPDARLRLAAHVECLVLFHAHRGDLAFLASSEIRALPEDARVEHIAQRDRQQGLLEEIIETGMEDGVLDVDHPHDMVRALITMCTGVSQWYRPGGALSPEQLADRYAVLAATMFGAGPDGHLAS
jgi:AcrR family transcriptional regulator